jgi:hypothetical protein
VVALAAFELSFRRGNRQMELPAYLQSAYRTETVARTICDVVQNQEEPLSVQGLARLNVSERASRKKSRHLVPRGDGRG